MQLASYKGGLKLETTLTIISVLSMISTFIFAYLTLRRNIKKDNIYQAKEEGTLLSDIKYIKIGIDKLERKLDLVENNYQDLLTRIIKLEQITKILRKEGKENEYN